MKLAALLLALALSACTNKVPADSIHSGEAWCKEYGGLRDASYNYVTGESSATCRDGTVVSRDLSPGPTRDPT